MPEAGLNLVEIESLDHPGVACYRNRRDRDLQALTANLGDDGTGLFMAEGRLVVEALIASRFEVASVLVSQERFEAIQPSLAGLDDRTPVYLAAQGVMDEIVGFQIHRGILAAGIRPPAPEPKETLQAARAALVLEGVANHDNVGGLFRTLSALAGPKSAVLLDPTCCDPLYRKSIRVSMGHALRVPFARVKQWPAGLGIARTAGFRIVALDTAQTSTPLDEFESSLPADTRVALMLGAEGPGLTPEASEWADERVRIPMAPGVDSLNIVVAAGIALSRLRFGFC